MNEYIDEIDWHILNAMADDWESAPIIKQSLDRENIDLTISEIIERLNKMHSDGLLELMPITKNNEGHEQWYEMTVKGRSIWDENAKKFGYED